MSNTRLLGLDFRSGSCIKQNKMWMHNVIVYVTIAVTVLEHSICEESWFRCMEGQYTNIMYTMHMQISVIYHAQVFRLTTKALIPPQLQAH